MKHFGTEQKEKVLIYSLSGIIIATFYLVFTHIEAVKQTLNGIISLIAPFLYGILIALCMLPFTRLVEKWLKHTKLKPRTIRKIAVIFTIILLIGIIVGLVVGVAPEIAKTSKNLTGYGDVIQQYATKYFKDSPILQELFTYVWDFSDNLNQYVINLVSNSIPSIMNMGAKTVTVILNLALGLFLTFFYLIDLEKFTIQSKRLLYAFVKTNIADEIIHIVNLTVEMFNSFIIGKLVDSLIIGIITFITMSILKLDYAVLIAIVVGITNIIPYFGPIFGAVPCAFLLLLVSPMQCLKFVILIIIIQQFDGNILGPYILGDKVSLPAFWILFSVMIFGGLFGFIGMFLGVPIFATIYALVKELVNERLEKKNINKETLK